MRLSKKIINTITLLFFAAVSALIFSACKPAIGTPWYPRSASSSSGSFVITGIQVKGLDVVPVLAETPTDDADKIKKFSEANTYTVNVPPEMAEVTAEDIAITAISSLSHKEALPVEVTVNGGSVPLSAGQVVPVTIKIADPDGKYAVQEKIINITQHEPYELELKRLTVCGIDAMAGSVTVPYKENVIVASKIQAEFLYGETQTVIPVEVENAPVSLKENEETEIKLFVRGLKGQYKDFAHVINVTRSEKPANGDEALELEAVYVRGVPANIAGSISVPENTEKLTADDIILSFKTFGYIAAEMTPPELVFNGKAASAKFKISAKEGKYEEWERDLTFKKDAAAVYNPQDKHGNKKYIVKVTTVTEEVDPFDYYDENYEFPASKFDEWVLHMPSMSGIIASYKFREGSWSGSPEMVDNNPSSIGSGVKAISNVKIYRYKTRAERWAGSYTPIPNPHDNRFYFYRFTANASMGMKPDNSMFCVDRYSKFLFYYSDPGHLKNIVGNIFPENWTDYAAPSTGDHNQFTKPFYMSDPVGYVKEDGSVVMYQWIKDNINAANYHAQENPAYVKPAGRSPGKAGYSPYRKNIIIKKTQVTTEINPYYTVSEPVIVGQPVSVYARVGAAVSLEVKVLPAPEGEALSYQWYKKDKESGSVEEISGANAAVYTPDTSSEINAYCYCTVKNTNSANGQIAEVQSEDARVCILSGTGPISVDAEPPKITKQPQPKTKTVPLNVTTEIVLSMKAVSVDGGALSYQWYKTTNPAEEGAAVSEPSDQAAYLCEPDTSSTGTAYYYCLVTNTNNNADGNKTATRKSDVVTIEVEEAYKVIFTVDGKGGSLTALYDGKVIDSGSYVKKGGVVKFIATPEPRYIVKEWEGVTPEASIADKTYAVLTVGTANAAVSVSFEPKMHLTITPKIENVDLQSWSTEGTTDHFSPKYIDGVHLAHNLVVSVQGDGNDKSKKWEYSFEYKHGSGGKGDYVAESDFIKNGESKTHGSALIDTDYTAFSDLKIGLTNYLVKSNRHDYCRTEYTYTIWPVPEPALFRKQCLDNNSVFVLEYNESEGKWVVNSNAVHINQVDADGDGITDDVPQLPRPAGFEDMDPNYKTISFKGVTITYDENFTLADGEEKDFVITYKVDNDPDSPNLKKKKDGTPTGTRSKGTVKVIYTIGWK